jgi:hypothetical protein
VETVDLAQVCGSVEATAEILGCSVRDVRRLVKADDERRTQTPNDQASRRGDRTDRSASMQLPDAGGNDDPSDSPDPIRDIDQVAAYLKKPKHTLYRWRTLVRTTRLPRRQARALSTHPMRQKRMSGQVVVTASPGSRRVERR